MSFPSSIEIAKVYLRSIIFIIMSWISIVVYGIYVSPVDEQVLLALIAAGAAVCVFDKPVIVDE